MTIGSIALRTQLFHGYSGFVLELQQRDGRKTLRETNGALVRAGPDDIEGQRGCGSSRIRSHAMADIDVFLRRSIVSG